MQIRRKWKSMVMQGTKQGNLYILQGFTMICSIFDVSQSGSHASNGSFDNSLWHLCLGHVSEKGLDILNKQGLLGNQKVEPLMFGEHCIYGKQHQTKLPKVAHTTKIMLHCVHFDSWDL